MTQENGLQMLNKVPAVVVYFWIIKVLATTVGETAADFLNFDLHFGLSGTSVAMGILLAVFLAVQLRSRQYVPWLYWPNVVLISIVGTLITDNLVDNFDVALETTTMAFGIGLLAVFGAWYASERTLSIRTIHTTRRELFYWAAILFTFALGTAAGDLTAEGLSLGYGNSALAFGALIALSALAYYLFEANSVAIFWIAYVLTRPLGASFGDYLAQPVASGGLGFGPVITSALFLSAIAALVTYLTITKRDVLAVPAHG